MSKEEADKNPALASKVHVEAEVREVSEPAAKPKKHAAAPDDGDGSGYGYGY